MVEALRERMLAGGPWRIAGSGAGSAFALPSSGEALSTLRLRGVVRHDADDQTVTVLAGTPLAELQTVLAERGQTLPIGPDTPFPGGTVGGALSLNLPHTLEAQCGSWRDWTLGLTVLRGDGTLARVGSRVVKSVAGYDAHKLFVGGRGRLGVVVEVTLRTWAIRSVPVPETVGTFVPGPSGWIHRVLPSNLTQAQETCPDAFIDLASGTLWCSADLGRRFPEDWVLGWGHGPRNLEPHPPVVAELHERVKTSLDPTARFSAL